MKKRIKVMAALTLSMAMLLAACGAKEEKGASQEADNGKKAESSENTESKEEKSEKVFGAFQAVTLEGEDVSESIFTQADLTMVNIWGTFCGPCIREMPDLGELSRAYEDKGVKLVGLISDVSEPGDETAEEIISTTKADYTHIVASRDLAAGILSKVSVVPTTIFVDKEGNQVGEVYSGARSKDDWQKIVDELLEKVQS